MSDVLTVPAALWPDAPPIEVDLTWEAERLQTLRSLNLLDTKPEDRFDRITRLASEYFQIPMAYVAFIDADRQWFKSRVGDGPKEVIRTMTFCQYTIHKDDPVVISDATQHPMGRNHPMVTGAPFLRFYAGVPLSGPDGRKIGSFCLLDTAPREFGKSEIASLLMFASLVEREISLGEIIQTQSELLETRNRLIATQTSLDRELADAAKYVRRMLPPPLAGEETIEWEFDPSTHLGGDGLGYRRIDDDQLAIYVLDVTGHGMGSALLAVTALELLRNPVGQVAYARPSAVVERLNRTFQMKDHSGKFFSVWYGVYSRSKRTITYCNAGHPPPLILSRDADGTPRLEKTASGGSVLGIMPEIKAPETTIDFPATSELYLFTDGLYELTDEQGGHGSHEEFVHYLDERVRAGEPAWPSMLNWLNAARKHSRIDDDVTLLRFATSP